MTQRVVEEGRLFLNDTLFPLAPSDNGGPGKVRVTDATQQHQPFKIVWNDGSGGMGRHRIGPDGPFNVSFDTSWDGRFGPGHLIPSGFINETEPSLSTGGGSGIALVNELDGLLVSTAGVEIYSYADGGGGWTNRLPDTTAAPVDTRNGNLNGTEYLVIAWTSGYAYADAIATWTNHTPVNIDGITRGCVNIEFHDYKLFGIDATGQCWFNETINGAVRDIAKINLSHGEVITGLFEARTKSDNNAEILYATTSKRLYALNFGQNKFDLITDISIGDNNEVAHERPYAVYKGKIYLASGRSIIEWDPVNLTIDFIGFDRGDGLPPGLDGRITCMASNTHELFVGTKAVKSGTDTAVVMAWNSVGWRRLWTDPDTTEVVDSLHVARVPTTVMSADAGGDVEYLFIGTTSRVHHVLINNSQTRSPNIDGWLSGAGTSEFVFRQHILPIFSVPGETTIALRTLVEVAGASSTVGIKVYVDFDEAGQTQMTNPQFTTDSIFDATDDRIEGAGTVTFTFPTGADDKSGQQFRSIQIAVESDTQVTTKGADVLSISLEGLVVEEIKESFEFVLDFREGASALPVEELRAAYETAKAKKTLVELSFRDEGSNPYVKIREVEGDEETGYLEEGLVRVRAEVI
ncbi:hypothetical protein LCGC14_0378440 [marine sediment metagenome]|uniref:Uncharacterized protein n=1 Tax=marine sediment metagenome TaxID=412755 RepID=A0A0F9VQ68_9ZZZZ